MVRDAGLEPALDLSKRILSPLRLPIPPIPQIDIFKTARPFPNKLAARFQLTIKTVLTDLKQQKEGVNHERKGVMEVCEKQQINTASVRF